MYYWPGGKHKERRVGWLPRVCREVVKESGILAQNLTGTVPSLAHSGSQPHMPVSINTLIFNIRFLPLWYRKLRKFSGFGQPRKSLYVFRPKCLGFDPNININVLDNCTISWLNSTIQSATSEQEQLVHEYQKSIHSAPSCRGSGILESKSLPMVKQGFQLKVTQKHFTKSLYRVSDFPNVKAGF